MQAETSLAVLSSVCEALTTPQTLDQALEQMASMTGELMETDQTVILLRDEERKELIVRSRAGINGESVRV